MRNIAQFIVKSRIYLPYALIFLGTAIFFFNEGRLTNDHYDRLSRGWQLLNFNEMPIRDFFDPGFLLTVYASATAQSIFGYNLLGDYFLAVCMIALGFTTCAYLCREASMTWAIALPISLAAIITEPRLYNFDKVFFFSFGLFMCLRYIQNNSKINLVGVGFITATASAFRYDSGLYIAFGLLTVLIIRVLRDREQSSSKQVFTYEIPWIVVGALILVIPLFSYLAYHGALFAYFEQAILYAKIEGSRSGLFNPDIRIDPSIPIFQIKALEGLLINYPTFANRGTAEAIIYTLYLLVPASALIIACVKKYFSANNDDSSDVQFQFIMCASVMSLFTSIFIVRNPIYARIGDVASVMAVPAAWLVYLSLSGLKEHFKNKKYSLYAGTTIASCAGLILFCISVFTLKDIYSWQENLERGPLRVAEGRWERLSTSPPSFEDMHGGDTENLIQYVRSTSAEEDRVMVTCFAPELPFYMGRPFGGSTLMLFGDHWATEKCIERIMQSLQEKPAYYIVKLKDESDEDFLMYHEEVKEYVIANYSLDKTFERYELLKRKP